MIVNLFKCSSNISIARYSDNMTKFKFGWFGGGTEADWWFGISPEGFGTLAMLINFVVSLTVCHITKEPSEEIQKLVEKIRIPTINK